MVTIGRPLSRARSAALAVSPRMRSTRFSTSRTLERYSSRRRLSSALTERLSDDRSSRTRSRILRVRWSPRFSKRASNASDGYTSIGTGESALCQEIWEL